MLAMAELSGSSKAEAVRRVRLNRIAAGLCTRCGKRPCSAGIKLCTRCRQRERKRTADRQARLRAVLGANLPAGPPMTDPVAWLAAQTFLCLHLRAKLAPADCVLRQSRKPETLWRHGKRVKRWTSTADVFCSSGECEQGRMVKLKIKGKMG